jgi:hypothetical protein
VGQLRVGFPGIPIEITVLASDLLPDPTLVTAARLRVFRSSAKNDTQGQTITAGVTVASKTSASYRALYTSTAAEHASRDTLFVFVESLVGSTWIPTATPAVLPVVSFQE